MKIGEDKGNFIVPIAFSWDAGPARLSGIDLTPSLTAGIGESQVG